MERFTGGFKMSRLFLKEEKAYLLGKGRSHCNVGGILRNRPFLVLTRCSQYGGGKGRVMSISEACPGKRESATGQKRLASH